MDATSSAAGTPSSTSEALVEGLLYELLELPPSRRDAALQRLCQQHPPHAATLRRRLALLQDQLPAAELPPPLERFGRFELLRRLGGGMADVYLAITPPAIGEVVIKILRHPELQDAGTLESFAREALAASRLQHPCIGTVLEIGAVDGVPYLVQPFLAGPTLAEWVHQRSARGQPLGQADLLLLLGWLEDIARALHCAHASGLIHRDVKPANILIPYHGRPRLLDFGLCQEIRSTPASATPSPMAGTLAYMAPELLSPRDRPVGPSADIYALGVTLYECVTMRLPFTADNREELCRAILLQEPPDPRRLVRGLSRQLARVLTSAMAKTAWERYASAADFADDLQRLRRAERVQPPRRRPWRLLRRWLAANRALATALVAILLLYGSLRWSEELLAAHAEADLALLALPSRLAAAEAAAERLVPGWPQQVPALQAWVHDARRDLVAALPELQVRLQAIDAGDGTAPATTAVLRAVLPELQRFATDPDGALAVVQARLQWAEQVEARTVLEPADLWRATAAAIAADPRYLGLQLPPQLDLVPLGPDPRSGLFEFYQPRSAAPGSPPVHRAGHGELELHDRAGLVFVLVPPGTFVLGQQRHHPDQARYDLLGGDYAEPEEVTLDAFFLSKYEMTQAQWQVLAGDRPAAHVLGTRTARDPPISWRHPVESVSWERASAVLFRHGLLLPTEAQWEYAAGQGAPTFWFFGNDARQLVAFANVDDRRFDAVRWPMGSGSFLDADDGYAAVAPVGHYLPNPFGLHDMIGNVAEWCRDEWVPYQGHPAAAGDGLRTNPTKGWRLLRVHRGSSFREKHQNHGHTANRQNGEPGLRADYLGLRPARPVLGAGR